MKTRMIAGLVLLAFGMIGAVVGNSLAYTPHGGTDYGNPLAIGVVSAFVAIAGLVVLVAWMFSELTSSGRMATRESMPAPKPQVQADTAADTTE